MKETPNKMAEFEVQLTQLDDIVKSMEQGGLSLQESLGQFEQGVALIKKCQNELAQAEQKIKILVNDKELEDYDAASD